MWYKDRRHAGTINQANAPSVGLPLLDQFSSLMFLRPLRIAQIFFLMFLALTGRPVVRQRLTIRWLSARSSAPSVRNDECLLCEVSTTVVSDL
jgi:hypothetical protein